MTTNEKQLKQQCVGAAEAVVAAAKHAMMEAEAKVVRAGHAVTAESPSMQQAAKQVQVSTTAARKAIALGGRAIETKALRVWKALTHKRAVGKPHA